LDRRIISKVREVLEPFVSEALPEGGVDMSRSRWQKPGRGYGSIFPGGPDVRYLRFLVEALYRINLLTGEERLRNVANAQVRFISRAVSKGSPTWAMGNALEMIGLYAQYDQPKAELIEAAKRILSWARERKIKVRLDSGFRDHFPCGYGCLNAKDAGWTNDLSMVGSGLVWAYELTGDESILNEAVSFAEYFVRPWRDGALGADGYWQAGTWSEDIGSWLIGPLHYTGFESTDAYGDEASWVLSTLTCIDYLTRLYGHRADHRFVDRCISAADWTFRECQFEDGGVGLCGRDDKWLGLAGDAVRQVVMLKPLAADRLEFPSLLKNAKLSYEYLLDRFGTADLETNGVEWVDHSTMADPMVNVAMLWLSAILGALDGDKL